MYCLFTIWFSLLNFWRMIFPKVVKMWNRKRFQTKFFADRARINKCRRWFVVVWYCVSHFTKTFFSLFFVYVILNESRWSRTESGFELCVWSSSKIESNYWKKIQRVKLKVSTRANQEFLRTQVSTYARVSTHASFKFLHTHIKSTFKWINQNQFFSIRRIFLSNFHFDFLRARYSR